MKRSKVSVLLTGIGGGGHGEQILKALRLGKLDYRIVGTDRNSECANRNEVDEFVVVPSANDAGYVDCLKGLAEQYECVALFHGSEPEMNVLSKTRPDFEESGIYTPVNRQDVMAICQDKLRTAEHLAALGYHVPEFRRIASRDDLRTFDLFPAIIKPSVGGGGSANVFIAQDFEEFKLFGEYLLNLQPEFIVQEYVGTAENEFTVGVLYGQDGARLGSIAIRRIINNALTIRTRVPNRLDRPDLGASLIVSTGISQGEVGHWADIQAQCEEIADSLNPTAPINIQCRVVDGLVRPFEINPRFSGTTSLRAMAGYNEPDVLVRRDVFGDHGAEDIRYEPMTILRRLQEIVC